MYRVRVRVRVNEFFKRRYFLHDVNIYLVLIISNIFEIYFLCFPNMYQTLHCSMYVCMYVCMYLRTFLSFCQSIFLSMHLCNCRSIVVIVCLSKTHDLSRKRP